jgi:SAM-dependent methyltransferase
MKISWYEEAVKRHLGEDGKNWIKYMQHLHLILNKLSVTSILDFGCSSGYFLETLAYSQKYGYEIDPVAVKLGREKGRPITSNWEEIPNVDCIIAVDVIEHLKSDELIEWSQKWYDRILPGGYLLIQTDNPYCLEALMDFYNDITEQRMYGEWVLRNILELRGFKKIYSQEVHPLKNVFLCKLYNFFGFPITLNPYYKYWLLMSKPPNSKIEQLREHFLEEKLIRDKRCYVCLSLRHPLRAFQKLKWLLKR